MISASSLLHTNWSDSVLLPLLPKCPILSQRGCSEETPVLYKYTGDQGSHFRLCEHLWSQKKGNSDLKKLKSITLALMILGFSV